MIIQHCVFRLVFVAYANAIDMNGLCKLSMLIHFFALHIHQTLARVCALVCLCPFVVMRCEKVMAWHDTERPPRWLLELLRINSVWCHHSDIVRLQYALR